MRILVVSALLGLTASCAWPPPHAAAPPAPTPPAVLAVAPAPPPPVFVAAPAPPSVDYVPIPLLWVRNINAPPPSGRLTLSNFSYDTARVQAVLASGPDCAIQEGTSMTDFVLPLNGTRIITTPAGADVCWRRELPPPTEKAAPAAPPWTEWNRAFTAAGRFLDSRL